MMDHRKKLTNESGSGNPDMMYLTKPRGRGYSLRMKTPDILIGTTNPWTNKPFGREIKLGLNTTRHSEALRTRDIRIGQIRQLEADALASAGRKSVGRMIDLTPESAAEWRALRVTSPDSDAIDHILTDKLEQAENAGYGKQARSFGRMVFDGAMPLDNVVELYITERSEGNPFGYDPLAVTTAQNLRSSVKHLKASLGLEAPTLHDVTPKAAFHFRAHYLPLTAKVSYATVSKHLTLLRGLWAWAIADKKLLVSRNGKPLANPWVVEERGTPRKQANKLKPDESRTAFTPEQVTALLEGFRVWGSRQGDLMRLALVTGCRVDEIGSMKLANVLDEGGGILIEQGKTENAKRYVPLVYDAQRLLQCRVELAFDRQANLPTNEQRLFPEWPLKPSTNKVRVRMH